MKRNILVIKDESGATAIEYGLIVALVSMGAIAGYSLLGDALDKFFGDVSKSLGKQVLP
jgi:pilus assembly protein Flp/PilA